jgi:hypothetical protein
MIVAGPILLSTAMNGLWAMQVLLDVSTRVEHDSPSNKMESLSSPSS